MTAIPNSDTKHHCWRCGWEDADTEMLESARHRRILADGGEDEYPETWGLLFDGDRTVPWKEGWIETDINMGVHGVELL